MHHDPFSLWVADAVADIVETQSQYLRPLPGESPLMLVGVNWLARMAPCQVKSYSKEWRKQDFAGLSADCCTVFH